MAAEHSRAGERKIAQERWLMMAGVAAVLLAAAGWFAMSGGGPTGARLRITAGDPEGLRHEFVELLARVAEPLGVNLEPAATRGSEDALERVSSGRMEMALIQGGLARNHPGVRQVASLQVEPLHLLVKSELHGAVSGNIAALEGASINLSQKGSGTHALALEVLRFAGLDGIEHPFAETNLDYAALLGETDRESMPDAVFLVSPLPSPVARHLVREMDYRLAELPFSDAFSLLEIPGRAAGTRPAGAAVERHAVRETSIPAYMYSVPKKEPPNEINTLGVRLLLVCHQSVPAGDVRAILGGVYRGRFTRITVPPLEPGLMLTPPEFPLHEGALDFLETIQPVNAAELMELPEKLVSFGAPLIAGVFVLMEFLRRKMLRARGESFVKYVRDVSRIERRAMELEYSSTMKIRELFELQQELSRLKVEALDKFSSGELEGNELLSGFLTQINDARGFLTRLILHAREDLEEAAFKENRPFPELWNETINLE